MLLFSFFGFHRLGLSGIDLGFLLLQESKTELKTSLPHIDTFCTLSPIPGFITWLNKKKTEMATLCQVLVVQDPVKWMIERRWREMKDDSAVKDVWMRLCAQYLTQLQDGRVLDPVGMSIVFKHD
jgi:malonyl-CoA decarboxylase